MYTYLARLASDTVKASHARALSPTGAHTRNIDMRARLADESSRKGLISTHGPSKCLALSQHATFLGWACANRVPSASPGEAEGGATLAIVLDVMQVCQRPDPPYLEKLQHIACYRILQRSLFATLPSRASSVGSRLHQCLGGLHAMTTLPSCNNDNFEEAFLGVGNHTSMR